MLQLRSTGDHSVNIKGQLAATLPSRHFILYRLKWLHYCNFTVRFLDFMTIRIPCGALLDLIVFDCIFYFIL